MVENKVVSTVVLDLTNSHQKVRINAVQSEFKLKNLEKEIKEKTISEMKESSYKESKTPREELLNYVVIDDKGNKMSKEEVKDRIEKKSLDNNQKDNNSINLSETNSMQIPQITILNIGLNEQTNKEKLISFFGKDITKFDHLYEAIQFTPKIFALALALAKKFGVNKDM